MSAPPTGFAAGARGDIASLNGIRALAVGLVFFSHGGGADSLIPGGLGVTIFFVLSGYLITTLLRREFALAGRIRLPAFYLRRLLRLMPPLLAVVGLAALLSAASLIDGEFSLRGMLAVLFYFGNYHVIANDFRGVPAGLGVVWSLAVEEHYYLLYPPLAWLLLARARRRTAILVLGSLCAVILAWRCWLALSGASAAYINMATDTRADAILIGCMLGFVSNLATGQIAAPNPWRDALSVAGCGLLLLATLLYRDEFFRLGLRYSLQGLAIAPLIALSVTRANTRVFGWLNARPMVYLGTVSYTIYLSHQMLFYLVQRHAPQLGALGGLLLTAALTLALAEIMRRWVEQPFADLRRQLHKPRSTAHDAPVSGAVSAR